MGMEEHPEVPAPAASEAITHTLVTQPPHMGGVLMAPTVPLGAVGVGVPISSSVFQGYHTMPQQAINPPALHQFSAFPPEMPEGTTVSFIPQPTVPMGEAGQVDPNQVALGATYMTHLTQVQGDGSQVLVQSGQPGMEHGYQEHPANPLAGSAPICMTTPMGLAQEDTQTIPTDMTPGEVTHNAFTEN